MAEPRDRYVDDSTEENVDVNVLYTRDGGLMAAGTHCLQPPVVKPPVPVYSCMYSTPPKDSLLPIEDLLAFYDCSNRPSGPLEETGGIFSYLNEPLVSCPDHMESYSSSEEEILSNQDLTLDKDEIARDLLRNEGLDHETSLNELMNTIEMKQTIDPMMPAVDNGTVVSAPSHESPPLTDEEEEEECEEVAIGPKYQAEIPDLLPSHTRKTIPETADRLLWDPYKLSDKEVEVYCSQASTQPQKAPEEGASSPIGSDKYIKDDEQALYLMVQCSYNVDEALRRRRCEVIPPIGVLSLWTLDECENFESGLRLYGKNFYQIHKHKVKTRSVKELVHFYYQWKKINRKKLKVIIRHYNIVNRLTEASSCTQTHQDTPSTPSVCPPTFLYSELKRPSLQDCSPPTELPAAQQWPVYASDPDYRPQDSDFAFTARPNFDAVSVTSTTTLGPSLYSDSECYGPPIPHTSAYTGHVCADWFPEAYCRMSSSVAGCHASDVVYPMLASDVYMDASTMAQSGQPPACKRFKVGARDYQRFSVDDFPADFLMAPPCTVEQGDMGFGASMGNVAMASRNCSPVYSRSSVFPSSGALVFSQMLGLSTLQS